MAVYAYLRVSTGKQDGENQRKGVDEFAKSRGFEITEYIDDEGVSGTKEPEKRELGKLMKKLKPGDVLIAGEISRLGRSLFMVMRILEYCMNNDVKVYTVKDGYELGDNIQSKVLAFAFGLRNPKDTDCQKDEGKPKHTCDIHAYKIRAGTPRMGNGSRQMIKQSANNKQTLC